MKTLLRGISAFGAAFEDEDTAESEERDVDREDAAVGVNC